MLTNGLTVYQLPHSLVSLKEFVGLGAAVVGTPDALPLTDDPESTVPPGVLIRLQSVPGAVWKAVLDAMMHCYI